MIHLLSPTSIYACSILNVYRFFYVSMYVLYIVNCDSCMYEYNIICCTNFVMYK